mgnify:CR=1 FL=1
MGFITYLDYNLYRKLEKGLSRYFRRAYKYLIFEAVVKLKQPNKIDGIYEVELPTDELVEKVYGKILLKFSVKNDIAIIEDIQPREILLRCYEKDMPIYKGIPYDTKKDLFKIKAMEGLCQKNKEKNKWKCKKL